LTVGVWGGGGSGIGREGAVVAADAALLIAELALLRVVSVTTNSRLTAGQY